MTPCFHNYVWNMSITLSILLILCPFVRNAVFCVVCSHAWFFPRLEPMVQNKAGWVGCSAGCLPLPQPHQIAPVQTRFVFVQTRETICPWCFATSRKWGAAPCPISCFENLLFNSKVVCSCLAVFLWVVCQVSWKGVIPQASAQVTSWGHGSWGAGKGTAATPTAHEAHIQPICGTSEPRQCWGTSSLAQWESTTFATRPGWCASEQTYCRDIFPHIDEAHHVIPASLPSSGCHWGTADTIWWWQRRASVDSSGRSTPSGTVLRDVLQQHWWGKSSLWKVMGDYNNMVSTLKTFNSEVAATMQCFTICPSEFSWAEIINTTLHWGDECKFQVRSCGYVNHFTVHLEVFVNLYCYWFYSAVVIFHNRYSCTIAHFSLLSIKQSVKLVALNFEWM